MTTWKRGRADICHFGHFWRSVPYCDHFKNENTCQSQSDNIKVRKGWLIPLRPLWSLSIPLWSFKKNEKSCIFHRENHQSKEQLTYPNVISHKSQHPTGIIFKVTRPVSLRVTTLKRRGADLFHWDHFEVLASHFNHLKKNEKSCIFHRENHQSKEQLTYPNVISHKGQHPTGIIFKVTRPVSLRVTTLKRRGADLFHWDHFGGLASHLDRLKKNEKSCISHCENHQREEQLTYPNVISHKGHHPTGITFKVTRLVSLRVTTLKRGRADLFHWDHFGGLASHFEMRRAAYHTVKTTKGRNRWPIPRWSHIRLKVPLIIVNMRGPAYHTVTTLKWGMSELSNCEHFWGLTSHFDHFPNEKRCLPYCNYIKARKGWTIPLRPLLRLRIPLWPF